ncbi:MAG: vitamin K epoxide reductase family protein [Acidobacteria bacterium]|jgi:uncharacterized membrane protein|nr:MAG: vitamin K epoxide reductase family protein [Acidobacteriota bacterium]GIU82257.1 MAG: hypothetical protein KatS3mg006_1321 [Pyrinomonadaceae bacterium]
MNLNRRKIAKFALAASVLALVGLADSIYLTIHHYTARPVPCSIVEGCEKVLTSRYATIWEIPIALFGAVAYFFALLWSILTSAGKAVFWYAFLLQTSLMAAYSAWLVYLQWAVIESFCQFCLLSAFVCFALFFLAVIAIFVSRQD